MRLLLPLVAVLCGQITLAQNYDADSVHYTRIPKTPVESPQIKRSSVFRDTSALKPIFRYYFTINSGAAIGCTMCRDGTEFMFNVSTIHGVTVGRKFRVGMGGGFEAYSQWKTFPVFGNVGYDVFGTRDTHALIIQSQVGWAPASYEAIIYETSPAESRGGSYVAGQIGYRIKYYRLSISLMMGYKVQRVYNFYAYPSWTVDPHGVPVQGTSSTTTLRRQMERFTMTIGLGWK